MNRIQRNIINLIEDLNFSHICFESKNADIRFRGNETEKINQILNEIKQEDVEWDIHLTINMFNKKTRKFQNKNLCILSVAQAFILVLGEINLTVTPRADRFASIEITREMKTLTCRRVVMDDVANEVVNNIIQLYLQDEEPHESSDTMKFFLQTNKI